MKPSSTSDSQFGLEMIPLDQASPVTADNLWQPLSVPIFDLQSTDPLPSIDAELTATKSPFAQPPTPETESATAADATSSSGAVWLDGDTLMCACPECQAPMSIRFWLMIADCWACQSSMELSEQLEREARQLWEQRHPVGRQTTPLPGVSRKPEPQPQAKPTRQFDIPVAGPVAKETYGQRKTRLLGTNAWITNFFRDTPAWLISLIFHMVLLTLLGLFETPDDLEDSITLSMKESRFVREGGTVVETDPQDEVTLDLPVPKDVDLEDPKQHELHMEQVDDARELREDFDAKNPHLPDIREVKRKIHDASINRPTLAARDPRVRVEMVVSEGGTTRTEAAVARGLRWLSEHQNSNGSWSLNHRQDNKSCACQNPGTMLSDSGATSLALLPFLGAGQTHEAGKYKQNVERGLDWLVSIQQPNGDLRHKSQSNSGMYAHGQGAIVLCEAYLLSGDRKLKKPAQLAINFIVKSQHPAGGWRYFPGQAGDTSVMGWQVMALQSARAARLNVPSYTLQRAISYLDRAEDSKQRGQYGYQPGHGPTPTMTAEGLLCRMYLGWDRNPDGNYQGINFLSKNHPPNKGPLNIYYLYYASQVFHHVGGDPWKDWNNLMRETLVRSQETSGHALGSWTPRHQHDRRGGRLYMTSLSVCCLEVYYRHLPLFRKINLE